MMDHQIEERLKQLGDATGPPESLVTEVMRRIEALPAHGSAGGDRSRQWSRIGICAAAVVAMAACIAGLVITRHVLQDPRPQQKFVIQPLSNPSRQFASVTPKLADYQHAFAQSPEALDALLQQQPAEAGSGTKVRADLRAGDLFRSDLDLYP